MICKRGGFIIQRHNVLRDLEAELLKMVCYDAKVEPGLQPVTGEELNTGANQSHDAHSDPGKSFVCSTEGGTFMPERL